MDTSENMGMMDYKRGSEQTENITHMKSNPTAYDVIGKNGLNTNDDIKSKDVSPPRPRPPEIRIEGSNRHLGSSQSMIQSYIDSDLDNK